MIKSGEGSVFTICQMLQLSETSVCCGHPNSMTENKFIWYAISATSERVAISFKRNSF
jgi:hypothetical protein